MNTLDNKTNNINTLIKMLNQNTQEEGENEGIYLTTFLDNKRVGSLLKSIRLIKSMTLVDMETITGISYQQIKKYEDNKSRISIANLKMVLDALDLKAELVISSASTQE
jgi:hypothetical protein